MLRQAKGVRAMRREHDRQKQKQTLCIMVRRHNNGER